MKKNKQDVLLLNPPYWSVHLPFLAIPCLSAFLKKNDFNTGECDLNIIHFNNMLQKNALKQIEFMMTESYFNNLPEYEKQAFECSSYEEYIKKTNFLKVSNLKIDVLREVINQLDKGQLNLLDRFLVLIYKTNISVPDVITQESILESFNQLDSEALADTLNISNILTDEMPKLIGFSIITWQQLVVSLFYANIIKKRYPDTKIVFGGSCINLLVNAKSDEELSALFSFADFLSFNEGETCLLKLTNYLVRGTGTLTDIPNLIYSKNGTVIRTDSYIEDFKNLPAPDFSDSCFEQYLFPDTIIPYQTSRGCFYGNCAFCNHDENYRRNYRSKSADAAVAELVELKKKYNINHVSFSDEAIHPDYFVELVNAIGSEPILKGLKWLFYSRVSRKYNPEIVKKAYECGCRMVFFGVESFNQRLLNHIKKGINAQTSIENIKLFHSAGISVYIWMMSGLPTQTKSEMLEDFTMAKSLSPHLAGYALGLFGLYESTDMYNDPEKYGIVKFDPSAPLQFVSAYNGEIINREEIDNTFYNDIKPQKDNMFVWDRYFIYLNAVK